MELEEWLPYWFGMACRDVEWSRLLQWEALQGVEGKIIDEDRRRRSVAQAVEQFRRRQELGLLPRTLDIRHVLLAMVALTMFPIAFPQLTRLVTGVSVFGEKFRKEHAEFLRRLSLDVSGPICVLGMHRSGTALVAHLLHRCGVYLGDEAQLR
jgi:hypothetical protein